MVYLKILILKINKFTNYYMLCVHILYFSLENQIDFLMEMALDKIAYLPFAYSVDLVSTSKK